MGAHFSLIDEPWIPCMPVDGGPVVESSILEVLTNASAYREIYDDSPLVTVSLHRLLLAILHRACGPTTLSEARALIADGLPVGRIRAYLDRWHDRFDLFSEQHPFYQTAGLLTGRKTGKEWTASSVSVIRLVNEAPDKNQPALFDHRMYSRAQAMSPAESARYLVAAQSYGICTSNSSDAVVRAESLKTPGCTNGPGVSGLWCWISGDDLRTTLLMNLVDSDKADIAAWERDDLPQTAKRSWSQRQLPQGIADRYTWQTRMVRVIPDCAAGGVTVRQVFFTQGRSAAEYDDDPMCAYQRRAPNEPWDAVPVRRNRAAWRDSHALVRSLGEVRRQPRVVEFVSRLILDEVIASEDHTINVVGLASGGKAAKFLLWRHDRLPAACSLLTATDLAERLERVLGDSERIGAAVHLVCRVLCANYLIPGFDRLPQDKQRDLLRANYRHPTDVDRLSEAVDPRRDYWSHMEGHFYTLLRELPGDKESASDHWYDAIAREAYAAFNSSANRLGQSARAIRARALVRPRFSPREPTPVNTREEEVSE